MARDASEGAILLLLISPHLRLDVINIHRLLLRHGLGGTLLGLLVAAFHLRGVRSVSSGEDLGLGQQIHVIIDLVVDVEVADILRDRVVVIGEIKAHRRLQPLRLPKVPRTADDALKPVVVLRHRRCMNRHHAAATGKELHQILPLIADLDVSSLLRVQDEHVCAIKLLFRRKLEAALALRAAFIQHRHPVFKKLREIVRTRAVRFFASTDEHAERLSSTNRRCRKQNSQHSGNE